VRDFAGFAGFAVTRAGAILAVSDFAASLRFYRDGSSLQWPGGEAGSLLRI
jgi:hypothetical protein